MQMKIDKRNSTHGESAYLPWFYLVATLICTAAWIGVAPETEFGRTWLRLSRWLPTVVAVAFILYAGKAAISAAISSLTVNKQQWGWLVASAVFFGVLALIASFLNFALIHPELSGSLSVFPLNAAMMVVVWSIAEELGWRGYALPRLIEQVGPVWASLVIGIAWWLWHTPGWLVGFGAPSDISYLVFGAWVVSASFVFTFFYMKSDGNVWTAVLLHAGANISFGVVPIMPFSAGGPQAFYTLVTLSTIAAALAVILMRKTD
ncbi:MAG: hypothetical protein DHS20C12_02030 [Pseudohongiella sp.]|nr:MAG: hypothetical protein DHS20C12_02030 [Pseudohongiella sp.]